uniref:Disease resistance protein RGA4 n=2 Tax=Elaeis guineensis var. tenera TaxID=51953 RepID=A0A8N4IG23_ELAGV|nr:putative disease resistance protein RGA4 [Elaeis guineensis]XP_029122832.1 putative disease resistance protein RGA4 [Elaeis guineensis]XP_029122834.1 putative disease resistance protein RGA4 [Elaeis guineensis]XP_029122836.1 putative disease resistance protein RGA4 [Elaeis guineensis]
MILESEWWEHEYVLDNILPSLALSYEHLNANLKQCFAYCSIFPKSYVFEKDRLVQMWMAQGFIQNKNGLRMRMEDIGSQIFDELSSRYFFLPTQNNKYEMHDLIRELAVCVSLDECLVISDDKGEIPETIRHLTLRTDNLDAFMGMRKLRNLRSILFFGVYDSEKFYHFLDGMLKQSKSLRVLDLSHLNMKLKKLPDAIGGLLHLRYLDVSCIRIEQLPKSICWLSHLQVLHVPSRFWLPEDMNRLINLRHLYGDACTISRIAGIGDLTNLQELEEFRVMKRRRREIGELKGLRNLRRQLSIKNLENVSSKEEAMEAMLKDKEHLTALHLETTFGAECPPDAAKEIFEGLQPHPSLEELKIKRYGGIIFPTWMVENKFLTNLESICLECCDRLKSLPPLGQLPFLKYLRIANMPAVKRIDREFYGDTAVAFPSLESLEFTDLHEWEEWLEADGAQFLPRLHRLHLRNCFQLRKVPLRFLSSSLAELSIQDCCDFGSAPSGCLESLTSLTTLRIACYRCQESRCLSYLRALQHLRLDHWPQMKLVGELQNLTALKILHLRKCGSLCLSNLRALKHLHLEDCPEMKLVGGLQSLTALEILHLRKCSAQESLCLSNLRALKHLHLDDCPEMKLVGGLQFHTALEILHLRKCSAQESLCLSNLRALKHLHLEDCRKIKLVGGLQYLTALEILHLRKCSAQESLCLSNLRALKHLHLEDCPEMKLVGGLQFLTALEILHLRKCPKLLESLEPSQLHEGHGPRTLNRLYMDSTILLQNLWILLGSLPSLKCLGIHSFYDITNFTGEQELWFQQLTSLQELEISGFLNLESLPTSLVNFSFIRRLTIFYCHKISLQSLQENELPASLEELRIRGCACLTERCRREGADWPKIAHIPFICLDDEIIQQP